MAGGKGPVNGLQTMASGGMTVVQVSRRQQGWRFNYRGGHWASTSFRGLVCGNGFVRLACTWLECYPSRWERTTAASSMTLKQQPERIVNLIGSLK
jgi:hypothetical protein